MEHRYIYKTIQKMKLLEHSITSNFEAIEEFIDSKIETVNFKKCSCL